jgi:hypothetical protein
MENKLSSAWSQLKKFPSYREAQYKKSYVNKILRLSEPDQC